MLKIQNRDNKIINVIKILFYFNINLQFIE